MPRAADALRKAGRSEPEIQTLLARWGVSRHIYVAPTDAQAFEEAKEAEMWYQESFRKFLIPERIEESHPTLQPGFRAMASYPEYSADFFDGKHFVLKGASWATAAELVRRDGARALRVDRSRFAPVGRRVRPASSSASILICFA